MAEASMTAEIGEFRRQNEGSDLTLIRRDVDAMARRLAGGKLILRAAVTGEIATPLPFALPSDKILAKFDPYSTSQK